ncbi:hypothetical protein VPH35_047957 [Triticum aestivum]
MSELENLNRREKMLQQDGDPLPLTEPALPSLLPLRVGRACPFSTSGSAPSTPLLLLLLHQRRLLFFHLPVESLLLLHGFTCLLNKGGSKAGLQEKHPRRYSALLSAQAQHKHN